MDLILFEERTIVNVNPTYSFLCSVFPRVRNTTVDVTYCASLPFIMFTLYHIVCFLQISSKVIHNQWNSLVNTLVTSVIADQSQTESLSGADLNELARRLNAVCQNGPDCHVLIICSKLTLMVFLYLVYRKKSTPSGSYLVIIPI